MLQSLLVISESLSVQPIVETLRSAACSVRHVAAKDAPSPDIADVQAIILGVPFRSLSAVSRPLYDSCKLPLLWWCDERHPPPDALDRAACDGLLFSTMSPLEIRWALLMSRARHAERLQVERERKHLQLRLEERKWIDQAKDILCQLKKIPEDQAYAFLRQQAMNERKKIADVARSIVNVYRLIHDDPAKSRRR